MRELLDAIRSMWRLKKKPPGHSFRREQTVSLASRLCVGPERKPIMHMERLVTDIPHLTGWLMTSGHEDAELARNPANYAQVSLPAFVREDPTLAPIIDSPPGSEWTRNEDDMIWRRIVDNEVVDSYGHVLATFNKPKDEEKTA